MSENKLWQRWLVALLLALGLGVIWGFLMVLGGSVVSALLPSAGVTYENLQLSVDGLPLIHTSIGGNYLHTELRTFDGQKVDEDSVQLLGSVSTRTPRQPPGIIAMPITWRERLAGMCDYARPPIEWVMIRDAEPSGHAYVAGFDSISKLPVGYIGQFGFRQTMPPQDEQFDLGPHRLGWADASRLASTGRIQFGGRAHNQTSSEPSSKQALASWIVYLADANGQIHEINLRTRTVRSVVQLSDVASVAVASCALPRAADEGEDDDSGDEESPASDTPLFHDLRATHFSSNDSPVFTPVQAAVLFQATPARQANKKRKIVHRLLVRCIDQLVLRNPFDSTERVFPLPEGLSHANFSVWVIAEDELVLLVHRGYWQRGNVVDLMWLSAVGEIARKETVRLVGSVPGNSPVASLGLAAIGPSPIAWLVGVGVAFPCVELQHHKADSYPAALRAAIGEVWPGLLMTIVVSMLAAWLVYRWQREYCRPNTRLWWLTTLVTGVPGLTAYWALHRCSPLEKCPGCGVAVPRDQDSCASCAKPFAEPQRLGTEIFA